MELWKGAPASRFRCRLADLDLSLDPVSRADLLSAFHFRKTSFKTLTRIIHFYYNVAPFHKKTWKEMSKNTNIKMKRKSSKQHDRHADGVSNGITMDRSRPGRA
jgi:hypothetical protein